ncbi:MAG: uncharacterized protein JWR08_222 [Enterovirga sp.]|jgi:hypothetical protein|nr:uncharacterized protein [Enterovirga sp.]
MSEVIDPSVVIARHQEYLPVNLDAIARDLNVPVYREPMQDSISGRISRRRNVSPLSNEPRFEIHNNSMHHPNRQRFTLAHEIAHYVLHRDLVENGIVDDTMYIEAR